ncbi:uncharacterized protein LOC134221926 [Armigeres subalbatus]|uniref:uncharacterized protein LOC134221926 n=1 Tax=Armigeres subalbatus TaxID=124917 RepID=UPI002ED0CDA2
MRQKFYVSSLRVLVRGVTRRCTFCKIQRAEPKSPGMAPLPVARITPYERSFSQVGIGYFGTFAIKVQRSNVKRWVGLFTCLVTRAVLLEVVASLSTESCKLALRRFIDRRGVPTEIYTDNGTNFQGTCRELTKQMTTVNTGLAETFTDANTKWSFIPPASPHMGGAWERMVRSVKAAMDGIRHLRAPTEEVFQTLCTEAESMVNSRPLTYIPLDGSDQEALTPNHFLLLSSSGWIREYLPTITRRTKWFEDVQPIAEGSLVFIVNEKERNSWVRGKVVKLISGADGRIRQADVQVATGGVLRRAVAKLAVLDVLQSGKAARAGHPYGSGNVSTGNTDGHMAMCAIDGGNQDHP